MKKAKTRGKSSCHRLLPCFALILNFSFISSAPIAAKRLLCEINEAYLGENNSLIINTKSKSEFKIQEIKTTNPGEFTIYIADADLSHSLTKDIRTSGLSAKFKELKNNLIKLDLKFADPKANQISSRAIVEGSAYEIFAEYTKPKEEEFNLQISKNYQPPYSTVTQSTELEPNVGDQTKAFLKNLDPQLAEVITTNPKFIHEMISKVDSITLSQIGDALTEQGHYGEAYQAYSESLKLDSHNNQAQLGVANTTTNNEERVTNLINSINSKALTALGEEWFEAGIKNYDAKQIAQSFVPFQLAILKEPRNPEMRFEYANMLEKAGFNFYEEAAKRYLEAAALAKDLYLSGDLKVENLMRKSAESLIKVACYLGKQEEAIKYCNSYLNLGFERFLDGRPVLGLVKEIRYNRNPFLKS